VIEYEPVIGKLDNRLRIDKPEDIRVSHVAPKPAIFRMKAKFMKIKFFLQQSVLKASSLLLAMLMYTSKLPPRTIDKAKIEKE
jgi:hypothetical protein